MRRPLALALLVVTSIACTREDGLPPIPPPSAASSAPSGEGVEVVTGPTTAAQAMRKLCISPEVVSPPVQVRPTPPSIAEVESQVETVRELEYTRPVNAEPVTPAEIDRRLREYFRAAYPKRFYARRTKAWRTIGAIPEGVGILEALNRYQQGQVLGFYNSQNGELVYTGDEELSRIEQFILAHELTHAIDDQHFDLDRLDEIAATCQDERVLAALGTVEGSANHFATQVVLRFPIAEIGDIPGDEAQGVPPLIVELQAYPYTDGQVFIDALADDGGPDAVNGALESFPVSTEQVLHPAKFGVDAPERVDVPDFAPTFGDGWRDLDVMVVGEVWLRALLHTRLGEVASDRAAAGWDGGMYRAWSDGDDVAVLMTTVWDTPADAVEFAAALDEWTKEDEGPATVVLRDGTTVHAGFGTDQRLEAPLAAAIGSL